MIKRNVFVIYVSDTIMSRKKISVSLSVILFIDSAMIKANAPQMSLKIPSLFYMIPERMILTPVISLMREQTSRNDLFIFV